MEENKTVNVAETTPETPAETTAPAATLKAERHTNKRGPRRNSSRFNRDVKEYEERVIAINRISKTVKGGRKMRFSALVIVGDRKGKVGFGLAKANEVPDAIRKALDSAKKNVIRVPLTSKMRTISHPVIGEYGAGKVMLKPASEGTGVIAGGAIRAILELAGYTDILSKCLGSRTPINAVRATVAALTQLKTINTVAKLREKKVEEIR